MRRDIGPHGLATVKSYESFVGYVYDDKVPMRRDEHGRLAYPEWDGGPVRGTLTIGYGHTNVARHPLKCRQGVKISQAEALEILHVDMGECVEAVNDLVKVPTTQGQFDALAGFTFNCGAGNLRHLIVPLNRGDYDRTRGDLMHYVRSKGEVMRGLERRRRAEQILWDDAYEELHAEHLPDEPVEHTAEVDARPARPEDKPTPKSVHGTAIAVGAGGVVEIGKAATDTISQVNDTISTVQTAHESIADIVQRVAEAPALWIGVGVTAGAFLLWRAHQQKGNQ